LRRNSTPAAEAATHFAALYGTPEAAPFQSKMKTGIFSLQLHSAAEAERIFSALRHD
jgi:hypothetical protein